MSVAVAVTVAGAGVVLASGSSVLDSEVVVFPTEGRGVGGLALSASGRCISHNEHVAHPID